MKVFLTEYQQGRKTFASYVIAEDKAQADKFVVSRNLNERIISIGSELGSVQTLERSAKMAYDTGRLLHHCVFLSFVNIKSEVSNIDEWLGDNGILHELVHYIALTDEPLTKSINEVVSAITHQENISIGLYE